MKSYDHFCFFSQINNSKKKKDEFAFFVFFTFKGWKRLLLADAPRQVINALTLYSFGKAFNFTTDISKYYNNSSGEFSIVRAGVLCTMIFTVVVWCGSAILLAIAAFMYIPLLCYIQGNLKEYCCHKIDKRIAELMKRKTKKRVAREAELAKREAAGDFRHLQDKKGRFKDGQQPLPQPTLPNVSLEDDELYAKSEVSSYRNGGGKGGMGGGGGYNYPPMPSMPDHAYSGYPDMQNGGIYHPQYQFSENGHIPGNDSSYSLAQAGAPHLPYQGYGYPPTHNDSTASFNHMNDDGASIKSRDPLLHMGDQSQLSLNRAPSYKTREDDDGAGSTYDFGRAYENYGSEKGGHHQQQGDYFSPDPAHPYAEPPYASSNYGGGGARSHSPGPNGALGQQSQHSYRSQPRSHPSSHHNSQDFDTQTPRTQSPAHITQQQATSYGETQIQPVNFNPQARGVSIAGRSEISTFYYNEHRDRASMADSHAGAFDLDDYARSSMFAPNAMNQPSNQQQWQNQYAQQRSSRLDYLEEEVEDDAYSSHQQPQRNNQNDHQGQRDWRR